MRNMQNCEMPKNDIWVFCPKTTFFRRSAVMKIFKIFHFLESLLKWWKSPPVDLRTLEMLIFDHLNEKYAELWNAQKWHFFHRSAVMKNFNFFDFLKKLLKWWKLSPIDHRTLEMWIFVHLGEKYAKMWNAQKRHFFAGPRSWKSSKFFIFWKAF